MSDSADSIYQSLQEADLLGPEHHRFKLIKHNATHSLGELWQAEDISVAGTPLVTLLIINPSLLKQNDFAEGIKKHAAQSKQLQNKHIAECYGFFPHKGGILLLAYEKLEGLTLASMIKRKTKLQQAQQLGLLRQIAYAVDMGYQKLHSPHGCLSPDTIFINRKGGVKLTLQAMRDSLESIASLVKQPLPYRQYQSPEAFHPGKLSRKTDVYSFATIVYELLTGTAAFNIKDSEADRVRKQLIQPDDLDNDQWEELQKALSTDTEQRFPNCTELMKAVFPAKKEEKEEKEEKEDEKTSSSSEEDDKDSTTENPIETETIEDENTSSLKDKLKVFSLKNLSLPKYVTYTLVSLILFLTGYLFGWGTSEFINFKENNFQALQIKKQQEALQQMYDSINAQQGLHSKKEQQLATAQTEITLLQQQLEDTQKLLKTAEPDNPGQQIFKDQINENVYGPEMVVLPSGDFRMGDQADVGDDNEKPVHIVTIEKPFALSRFEITFAEYDLFATATKRPLPDDSGWGRGNQPVINVSWRDAVAYADWLSNETGQPYRLPSEAEWEYAARGGTLTTYWWGDDLKPNMAVCAGCDSPFDGKKPAPVGSFPANGWGLHDMTGNIDEWVADCYADNYRQAPIDGSAYKEKPCKNRAMRGGSWFEIDRLIRPASRYRHPVDTKRNSWGFRVALDIK